ncbi:MAG: type II secretion system protein [Luteolibacter sp.]|jgi:prepilin-type N-terminal cleavage/methylation domain-containing protein/prepilin-type processing-associated H-X9-DG protein|nr:type II secretion system protein [Luteolibacter sp.]
MMKARGFTLMELLIVLAVAATLAGIGIPLGRSVLAKSREAACLNQLRSLGVALESYLQDHNQILPKLAMGRSSKSDDSPVLETVLLPYVEAPGAFRCPQDAREFEKSGSSYFWNHLQSELPVSRLVFFNIDARPDKIPLISDKEAWHPNGINFLYADQTSSNRLRFATGN